MGNIVKKRGHWLQEATASIILALVTLGLLWDRLVIDSPSAEMVAGLLIGFVAGHIAVILLELSKWLSGVKKRLLVALIVGVGPIAGYLGFLLRNVRWSFGYFLGFLVTFFFGASLIALQHGRDASSASG